MAAAARGRFADQRGDSLGTRTAGHSNHYLSGARWAHYHGAQISQHLGDSTTQDYGYDATSIRGIDFTSNYANAIDSIAGVTKPLLQIGLTGSHEYFASEFIREHARSADMTLAYVEGVAAIEFKVPTSQLKALVAADPSLVQRITPRMAVFGGAVPLIASGRILGAIGASGASSEQDEACATAGANRISSRLN
jgi:hypothetical protein